MTTILSKTKLSLLTSKGSYLGYTYNLTLATQPVTLQCLFSTIFPVISSHLLCELLWSIILKTGLEGYVGNVLKMQIQGREKSEKKINLEKTQTYLPV